MRAVGRRRTSRRRTVLAAAVVTGGWSILATAPAFAGVTGPCDGQVTIDGVTYTPANDTAANPIVVPADAENAAWQGRTTGPITDYVGELGVRIGPGTVRIADWVGANDDLQTSDSGDYALAGARDDLPTDLVGLYEVTGSHVGEGGSCAGSVMVRIEGSPLSTPLGAAATGAGVLSIAGLAAAGAGAGAATGGSGGSVASGATGTTGTTGTTTEVE